MENPSNPGASDAKLLRTTTEKKLVLWQELIIEEKLPRNPVDLPKLESWSHRATESRIIRNQYVHGNWALVPSQKKKPVRLSTPPWWREAGTNYTAKEFTMEELETSADEVESMFKEFMAIRDNLGL